MEYAQELSKWDVVGFTVSVQDQLPELVPTLRRLNPEIVAITYVPASFFWASLDAADPSAGPTVDQLEQKIRDCDWWLYDNRGNRVGEPGNLWFTNLSTKCPPDAEGKTLPEWLAEFIASEVLADGQWDGVFLDGTYEEINWLHNLPNFFETLPAAIDCDRNGVPDDPESLNVWWKGGLETLLATLRESAGSDVIIIPNGNNYMYQYANGGVRENFPHMNGGWQENMFAPYGYIPACNNFLHNPANVTMMVCYWKEAPDDLRDPGSTPSFERFNRFTLTSALLGDGYYFFDRGSGGSLWWRDYYDLDLGAPLGEAYLDTVTSRTDGLPYALWRRDFENALVLCNPFNQYVAFDDGKWLYPEDGRIKTYALPGPLGMTIDRSFEREFDHRARGISVNVIVANPHRFAAQACVWAELANGQATVVEGFPREIIVGAQRTDTIGVALRVPAALPLGTYRLKILLSGTDLLPVASDTVYVDRVINFEKEGKPIHDSDSKGYSIYPQPTLLSQPGRVTLELSRIASTGEMCSVSIYTVEGRLLCRIFKGRLEETSLVLGGDEGFPRSPGVYFLEVETPAGSYTRKIVLLD